MSRPILSLLAGTLLLATFACGDTSAPQPSTASNEPTPSSTPTLATPELTTAKPSPAEAFPAPPEGIASVSDGVTPPVVRHKENPTAAELPQGNIRPGALVLRAVIDEQGTVESVTVLRDRSVPPLGPIYAAALQRWRFDPATRDGKPIKFYYDFSVTIDVR